MKVELEFSVDKEGNVADIKILSASNTEVAKVAADILRKSPRWTPLANNARARIVINF
jgi:outer membrane biosynthesis protein TonB